MASMPVNTLVFSGFGDTTQFRFYSPAGVDLGQPDSAPTFEANGATNGMSTFDDGTIFQEGYPQGDPFDPFGPRIWSADFATVIADYNATAAGQTKAGCCDGVGNGYYLARASTNLAIIKVSASGIVTLWTLTGYSSTPLCLAVNQAGTVAYLAVNVTAGSGTVTVKKVDLTTGVETTFVTTTKTALGNAITNMLCLGDDTLVVGWARTTAAGAPVRYDTSGSVLNTYSALLGTIFVSGYSIATGLAHAYTSGSGVRPIDTSKFYIGYYAYGVATDNGMSVSTIDVATGTVSDTFSPEDGTYEFDGPFTALRIATTTTPVPIPVPPSTPAAPQINCTPQTQTGNGGKGAAGCNTGGVGWTRSYLGPFGTVPQHPDPSPCEALTGKEGLGIEAWIELVHTSYPSLLVTTHRRAMVPLGHHPTKDGYKPDGLLAIGDVEHALGNEQGGFEAATVDIQFTDQRDRLFRTLLQDQELEGDELRIKLSSDPAAEDAA